MFHNWKDTFNVFITNVFITNAFITNVFITNAFITNVFITNAFITNAFITNAFITNAFITNAFITNAFITNAFITNAFIKSYAQKTEHIRWVQRFENYQYALEALLEAVELSEQRPLTKLEQQGLIQEFEFTHELAWKTLKDFLDYRGVSGIIGSRDATRVAFREGLVSDGEVWMEMIKSRNLTSYTYREETANAIAEKILGQYFVAFKDLKTMLTNWLDDCS